MATSPTFAFFAVDLGRFKTGAAVTGLTAARRVLLALILAAQPIVQPAFAACTTNADCDANHVCMNAALPGTRECRELRCNANSECPRDRPTCSGGACRSLTGTGGLPTGGMSQADVGGACGQVKIGQVTKSIGCKTGLQCVKVPATAASGTCQRPPQ